MMNRSGVFSTWIGASDMGGIDKAVFISNEKEVDINLFDGTPNHWDGDCVCVRNGALVMKNCDESLYYICEKNIPVELPVEAPRVTTTVSTTPVNIFLLLKFQTPSKSEVLCKFVQLFSSVF